MVEKQFRFQDLQIWQRAAAISGKLFKLAEKLDELRYYRFAEHCRAATLRITNNIAEGSGSISDADFANFLNMARRSIFEGANMLVIFSREGYLADADISVVVNELEEQSRMILAFRRRLKN